MENNNELYHHGILGMKWGKKNGPPYPLDYSKLSYAEREAAKGKAVASGNVKEAAKNINYFDNDELRKVRERFQLNQDINKLNASTVKTGKQKIDEVIDWANRFGRGAEVAMSIYNKVAKFNNAFVTDEDKMMPVIGEKKAHKNKAEGKTKRELKEMLKNQKLSTKDYEDIKNRLNMINDAEKASGDDEGKLSLNQMYAMANDPSIFEKATDAQRKYAVNFAKDYGIILNSSANDRGAINKIEDYNETNAQAETASINNALNRKRERERYYYDGHLNHGEQTMNKDDYIFTGEVFVSGEQLMHYAKGQIKKNPKYISRKQGKGGKWLYTYAAKTSKKAPTQTSTKSTAVYNAVEGKIDDKLKDTAFDAFENLFGMRPHTTKKKKPDASEAKKVFKRVLSKLSNKTVGQATQTIGYTNATSWVKKIINNLSV